MRILVVEDEHTLQTQLNASLAQAGFSVDAASDGREGLFYGREYSYDLAIIDLGLPKLDGLELIQQLRKLKVVYPILILTARDHWREKVRALEIGADDYMVKPFHMEEVHARINALIRRSKGLSQPVTEYGPIRLNLATQEVTVNGFALELTAYEYKVLEYLILHPGEVISKTTLTEHIYAQDFDRDSNTIEVFVGRLRRKLDPDNALQPIETLRGRGYRFVLQ